MLAPLDPIRRNVCTENVSRIFRLSARFLFLITFLSLILVAVDVTIFQRSVLYPFLDELKDKRSGELIAERSNEGSRVYRLTGNFLDIGTGVWLRWPSILVQSKVHRVSNERCFQLFPRYPKKRKKIFHLESRCKS